jgi:hypothetical protein
MLPVIGKALQLASHSWCGYEPSRPSSRRRKSSAHWKGFHDRTRGCSRSKGRSHCCAPDRSAAWYCQDQGGVNRGGILSAVRWWVTYICTEMALHCYVVRDAKIHMPMPILLLSMCMLRYSFLSDSDACRELEIAN